MKIVVPIQLVPDLVEELIIANDEKRLDPDEIRWIINEYDNHAIEQAILIKEKSGAEVIIIAPDLEGADDALYTAAAKGADKLVKISEDFVEEPFNTHALAKMFAEIIKEVKPDLVLTGVFANNSLDGALGPILAQLLGMPYVGYISGVGVSGGKVAISKEFPGGLKSQMEANLPAVLGIQASETPPRYVPFSKTRQAMKERKIDEESGDFDLEGGLPISKMYLPIVAKRAEMLKGDENEIAEKLVEILKEAGII